MSLIEVSSIKLTVITSSERLVDEEVQEVSLPGLDGYIGVLPGHRPLLLALGEGLISYKLAHTEENFPVRGGYAEVFPDKILVFTELNKDEVNRSVEG
jgi:F-type H+-transporting ATPase subunit epsilon